MRVRRFAASEENKGLVAILGNETGLVAIWDNGTGLVAILGNEPDNVVQRNNHGPTHNHSYR
jgi:hypothetical protein